MPAEQAVVHAVHHRLQRAQIGEHRFQVVIGEILEFSKWHDRSKLSSLHVPGAHALDKQSLVVVANACGLRGDIGAGYLSLQNLATAVLQTANRTIRSVATWQPQPTAGRYFPRS